jgi:hypothetical protein
VMAVADAPTSAARRSCLLGINCGEQFLHGARRRCAERLVEMDRVCKLLADEVIAPREFVVAGKRPLDEIGVAAAQRPSHIPRQQNLDFVANRGTDTLQSSFFRCRLLQLTFERDVAVKMNDLLHIVQHELPQACRVGALVKTHPRPLAVLG